MPSVAGQVGQSVHPAMQMSSSPSNRRFRRFFLKHFQRRDNDPFPREDAQEADSDYGVVQDFRVADFGDGVIDGAADAEEFVPHDPACVGQGYVPRRADEERDSEFLFQFGDLIGDGLLGNVQMLCRDTEAQAGGQFQKTSDAFVQQLHGRSFLMRPCRP